MKCHIFSPQFVWGTNDCVHPLCKVSGVSPSTWKLNSNQALLLCGGLEHLKIETRLIDKSFESEMTDGWVCDLVSVSWWPCKNKRLTNSLCRFLNACLSRRVSDEVFDEGFCEFFIPTEDCWTAAKLTGLGNTRKLFKMESFRGPQQAWFHFVHSTVKFENRKNKKTFDERNGESARIWVQLQLQINSLRKGVVCLEVWIWQVMVWAIITWETSTMVPHCLAHHRIASFTYMSD
jgi:hypothetical protein